MSRRPLAFVTWLAVLSVWCVALLEVRDRVYGAERYSFLVWNLLLAWIPFAIAISCDRMRKQGTNRAALTGAIGLWLLFFPNAPYMLTDFVHLGSRHRGFDVVLVGSFTFAGLALAFASLVLVQRAVADVLGVAAGWGFAMVSLVLASVGIYLGRVQRLNSWDAIEQPHRVLLLARIRLADPFGNLHLLVFVSALAGFLTLAYLAIRALAGLVADADAR
jgi:uncharacterized membrane protein